MDYLYRIRSGMAHKKTIKYLYWAAWAPMLATVAGIFIGVEFSDLRLNSIVLIIDLVTPCLLGLIILVSRTLKDAILRAILIFLLTIVQLLFGVLILFAFADFPHEGIDQSVELLHRLDVGSHHYVCYRFHSSPRKPYGIDIRDERRGFGLVLYRSIAGGYPASDARFFQQQDGWYVEVMNDRSPHTIVKLH